MVELADRLNAALAGRYAIQRELGRSSMPTVFLRAGRDDPLLSRVAKTE